MRERSSEVQFFYCKLHVRTYVCTYGRSEDVIMSYQCTNVDTHEGAACCQEDEQANPSVCVSASPSKKNRFPNVFRLWKCLLWGSFDWQRLSRRRRRRKDLLGDKHVPESLVRKRDLLKLRKKLYVCVSCLSYTFPDMTVSWNVIDTASIPIC